MRAIQTRLALALIPTMAFAVDAVNAQTPINAPGAMQPSTGTGVFHIMPQYREVGSDPTSDQQSAQEYIGLMQVAYGLASNFSLQFDAPLVYSKLKLAGGDDDEESGVGDMTLLAKYRLFQHDNAATETTRFSAIAGLQIPGSVSFEMDSSNDAWDPIIGGVFSTVQGRHGFNASALWEFYTGDEDDQSDSLRYDASYLFRWIPEQYTSDTTGALYAVLELNGFSGTNGDNELYLSPGVMYESQKFTLDASMMIPVWQDVDHRAESEFIVSVGLRLSF